ncbi:hypothetical protein BAUCODRAFT_29259 [Baudoinia panamericana UAMH 10762]|uniref:Uncharacterized protein n=1 Tax=Baudoinia panamericana (strain UAMH 10762) TaxID=717646 RepID=M2NMW3_BAUPA|nr:uncharacterized protein BAUCODRAFT_29259 [Baudoinia panamericana UAMH 10762]EMD00875.1 hypothetical protein BAUCODRAFT_29259 [Baudoinia panamericana UAMH 10762]
MRDILGNSRTLNTGLHVTLIKLPASVGTLVRSIVRKPPYVQWRKANEKETQRGSCLVQAVESGEI